MKELNLQLEKMVAAVQSKKAELETEARARSNLDRLGRQPRSTRGCSLGHSGLQPGSHSGQEVLLLDPVTSRSAPTLPQLQRHGPSVQGVASSSR